MSDSRIVPFGKYKGRPLDEVLESDPSYLELVSGEVRQPAPDDHQPGCRTKTLETKSIRVVFLRDVKPVTKLPI